MVVPYDVIKNGLDEKTRSEIVKKLIVADEAYTSFLKENPIFVDNPYASNNIQRNKTLFIHISLHDLGQTVDVPFVSEAERINNFIKCPILRFDGFNLNITKVNKPGTLSRKPPRYMYDRAFNNGTFNTQTMIKGYINNTCRPPYYGVIGYHQSLDGYDDISIIVPDQNLRYCQIIKLYDKKNFNVFQLEDIEPEVTRLKSLAVKQLRK